MNCLFLYLIYAGEITLFIQEMGTNKRIEILKEISSKGGLLARCAGMYLDDEVMGHKFILECSEQCHIEFTTEYFGKKLVSDILKYSKKTGESV